MKTLSFLVCFAALMFVVSAYRQIECGRNEEYTTCGTCDATCDNRNPICTQECKVGCFCKRGYIRNKSGQCIRPNKCPKGGNTGTCGDDEEYNECGSHCAPTCENYGDPRICPAVCVPGCFCKKGLVRNSEGRCVIPEMCYKAADKCYEDEEYTNFGTACPDTCDNYGKPRTCTLQFVQGCFCKKGLVRRDDFRCVIPERCDKTPGECNKDEIYTDCGTACPDTCENYGTTRPCPAICIPGCVCRNGLVRDVHTMKCIRPNQCKKAPGKCNKDEISTDCGAACPDTCENYGKPRICTAICAPGCICRNGLVRDVHTRKCIRPNQCKKGEYCPRRPFRAFPCGFVGRQNQCCSDIDCGDGFLCCTEKCGNRCLRSRRRRSNGVRAEDDPNCRITI